MVRGPVVKGNDLVAYAANAAHVPESTIRMAKEALFQAIVYYCTQGHPVEIPNLGTISVGLRTKTVRDEDDLNADVIRQKYLRWFPKKELQPFYQFAETGILYAMPNPSTAAHSSSLIPHSSFLICGNLKRY